MSLRKPMLKPMRGGAYVHASTHMDTRYLAGDSLARVYNKRARQQQTGRHDISKIWPTATFHAGPLGVNLSLAWPNFASWGPETPGTGSATQRAPRPRPMAWAPIWKLRADPGAPGTEFGSPRASRTFISTMNATTSVTRCSSTGKVGTAIKTCRCLGIASINDEAIGLPGGGKANRDLRMQI